jgi:hypothetical protein
MKRARLRPRRRNRAPAPARTVAAALVLASCWAPACSSTPAAQDPLSALALAEDRLQGGEFDVALALARTFGDTRYGRPDLERKKIIEAKALMGLGEHFEAYRRIRDFPDEHRFSVHFPQAEQIEFAAGKALVESTHSFLFFSNDADEGQAVLEHFVSHYPRSLTLAPDALRLLGEKAFTERSWALARERYGQILRDFPSSEWAALARFKVAMSRFRQLKGPEYDLETMILARNELKDFLAGAPENPGFRAEANDALVRTRLWLAQKHLGIADYYKTLKNRYAEVEHLKMLVDEYGETEEAAKARARLAMTPSRPSPAPPR